jgi:hypothetical protein
MIMLTRETQTTRNGVSLAVKPHYHSMPSCHVIPHKIPEYHVRIKGVGESEVQKKETKRKERKKRETRSRERTGLKGDVIATNKTV